MLKSLMGIIINQTNQNEITICYACLKHKQHRICTTITHLS